MPFDPSEPRDPHGQWSRLASGIRRLSQQISRSSVGDETTYSTVGGAKAVVLNYSAGDLGKPKRLGPNVAYFFKIEVPREQQGKGIASQLLQHVLADADKAGTTLLLDVDPYQAGMSREQLQAFYSRHGFVKYPYKMHSMVRAPGGGWRE